MTSSHPPEAENVILIDFDNTISPWGHMFNFPEPFKGAGNFMHNLKSRGYRIGIFTSRLSPFWLNSIGHTDKQHRDYIKEYGERYNIPFDFITAEKVPAIVYVDDKAITFNGSWNEISDIFVAKGWL